MERGDKSMDEKAELREDVQAQIEALALVLVTMDGEDRSAMGEMLNQLSQIEAHGRNLGNKPFLRLVNALKGYLDKVMLHEATDLKPFEVGLEHLQHFFRAICNQVEYDQDLGGVLAGLGYNAGGDGDDPPDAVLADTGGKQISTDNGIDAAEKYDAPNPNLDDEDRDIISGFVMESLDGLETVEVSLMDLEQHPDNPESINGIFRSFHTIKGVSSLIGLMRINRLAHEAENLLNKIRGGELVIAAQIVDVILDAVDMLKQLIEGVGRAMACGGALDVGLDIAPLVAKIEAVQHEGTPCPRLGEIMVERGIVGKAELHAALVRQEAEPDKKLGEILVEAGLAKPKEVVSALRNQKTGVSQRADLQVKVDTKKLDNLVDMAGELVIAQSMLRQHPQIASAADQRLVHTLGQLNQISTSLQAMTMSLRMVPIKSTFQKMLRLVRDLSRNSNKDVLLTMSGEETEIDRNVVDDLYEPMVHMIRNSVDHGLETPDARMAAGKDPTGEIHLKAFHRSGNIIVQINDDGRGLNRQGIIETAKTNGLISDESNMSDDEIYNLIFRPGFSTAKEVSEISGRGVGLDVVKKGIEKLRGRVDINTRPGEGTTIVISLPLTLAIIEGMLVRVGEERYVLPALSIIESFQPRKEQYATVEGKGELILTRGRLIPLVRLHELFGCSSDVVDPWKGLVVTVEYDDKQMCLLLDELLGKEEVVIKSMGDYLKNVQGISGGAILGDGKVGLILDMAGLWQLTQQGDAF
jgi:two-component system chemotaxis sensor kinase CheA